jgi:outer membrane protein TolC
MRTGVLTIALTLAAVRGGPVAAAPLSVEECVQLALGRAPTVYGAAADTAAADARVRAARAKYWPRFVGQAQYGHSEGYDVAITNGGVTALNVGIEAPLLDGGLRDAELAGARARMQSAAALEQQRRADVAFAVRNAYYTALEARSETAVHSQALRRLQAYLALLERQEALGMIPLSDSPRAELAVETARGAERVAHAALTASTQELGTLVGAPITAEALVAPVDQPHRPADEARIDASPVIADARAAADAARRDADAVRSEARSHLLLTADAGFLGVNPGSTFQDHGGGEFLFGFSLPLFDGGAIDARIAAATAAVASAEANVRQARDTLTIALARARADAERGEADAVAWARTQPAAAESFLLLRARYFGGGGVKLLEVLDALNQVVAAQLSVARSQLVARLAIANQAQLLGQTEP